MKTQDSFDLNDAVQRWRENLAQSPAFRSENLNELESHLRDSIATLESRGLSEEESFLIATKRIGKGGALEAEFGKLNRKTIWMERLLWILIGIQAWELMSGVSGLISQPVLMFGWKTFHFDWQGGSFPIAPAVLFAVIRLIALAASAWLCWWLIFKKGRGFNEWIARKLQPRSSFVICCVTLWLLFICMRASPIVTQILCFKFFPMKAASQISVVTSAASAMVQLLRITAMVVLTLMVARKRMRTRTA